MRVTSHPLAETTCLYRYILCILRSHVSRNICVHSPALVTLPWPPCHTCIIRIGTQAKCS